MSAKKAEDTSPFGGDLDKIRDILFGEQITQLRTDLDAVRAELQTTRDELESTRAELAAQIEQQSANGDNQFRSFNASVEQLRNDHVSRSSFASALGDLAKAVQSDVESPHKNGTSR